MEESLRANSNRSCRSWGSSSRRTFRIHLNTDGVVEWAVGFVREQTVALLRGMTTGKNDRLWAEAMNYACEMSNRCTTTSLNPGVSAYELWVRHRPTFDHLILFGTVGYLRRPKPEHKLAPLGAKCIMLGGTVITRGEPSPSATTLAKLPCARPSYGTPQPTREGQFPETRRLEGGGATQALLAATQENLQVHVLTGEPEDRLGGAGIRTA